MTLTNNKVMERLHSSKPQTYVETTANNYQSRYKQFAAWADDKSNANAAKRCRDLLLHFLSVTMSEQALNHSRKLQTDHVKQDVRILDAGCGSGRDLIEFSRSHITILSSDTGPLTKPLGKDGDRCFNAHCAICSKGRSDDEKLAATERSHHLKIKVSGFDVCPGFVNDCFHKGLNVKCADFFTFFSKDKSSQDSESVEKNNKYHAIFALASLFHLPKVELVKALLLFKQHLCPDVGILLTTIPSGSRDELGSDGRWMLHLSTDAQTFLLEESGFEVLCQETISIYNGNNWVVLVSKIKA